MSRIVTSLERLFEKHRIVVWNDEAAELRFELDGLDIPGVTLLPVDGNEFGLKHRVLREEPASKFLLYREGPAPADADNWLLDVELSHGMFRADQIALWLADLGLGLEFADVIKPHAEFFKAKDRFERLAESVSPEDSATTLKLKMVAAAVGSEPRLDSVLERLLADHVADRDTRWSLLERTGLDAVLWDRLRLHFEYDSDAPGLQDFVITLFKSSYASEVGGAPSLSADALIFVQRWKDSARYGTDYESLSGELEETLDIGKDLEGRTLNQIAGADTFEMIDRRVLSELARCVSDRTLGRREVARTIRRRRETHWFDRFRDEYEAVDAANQLLAEIAEADLSMASIGDAVDQYRQRWYRVDQLYRRFVFRARRSGHATLFAQLKSEIDARYSNDFLVPLGEAFHMHLAELEQWPPAGQPGHSRFFGREVGPYLAKDNKVVVVISDALRYEIGEELQSRILSEDRYECDLGGSMAPLPSITKLGMATLLPGESVGFGAGDSAPVLVDGMKTQGTEARGKVLAAGVDGSSLAIQAQELLRLDKHETRAVTRDNNVVYVYHNRIDSIGDKRDSEERVFEAAEETLNELVLVVKKLVNANASHVLITSDHGFLYQDDALEESDFLAAKPEGEDIVARKRRLVLGRGLKPLPGFKHFTSAQLGLEGDLEVLIPNSIGRLRTPGGSRYVHGGATLQEVVVPLLHVTKKRSSDISYVEVDIFAGSTSVITTGQLAVTFYQTKPVTKKRQARLLRAGLFAKDGTLLSSEHEITFDHGSEHEREREFKRTFILTKGADEYNGQEVLLRLQERIGDTSHWRDYKSRAYTIRRSFTSDFDF